MSLQADLLKHFYPKSLMHCIAVGISLLSVLGFITGTMGMWMPSILHLYGLLLLLLGCVVLLHFFPQVFISLKMRDYFHNVAFGLFCFTIILHLIGVFAPETGFDALWYHLPLIKEYSSTHQLVYDNQMYQSLYPQYGDILLLFGYTTLGVVGAKLVAYLFFIFLIYIVFTWLRDSLSTFDSLLGTLVVCYFQVVSWQSSSAYVDIISAVFFLWSVYYLFKQDKNEENANASLCISALAAGVFLGTKFVNVGFIPLFVLLTGALFYPKSTDELSSNIKRFVTWWGIVFLFAFPWYLRAFWYTGSFIYPIGTIYADPVIHQMGVSGWKEWIILRSWEIWKLPAHFFVFNDGYVSPLIVLFLPIAVLKKKFSKVFILELLIGIYGLLFWFFFPPPSTRYVLEMVIVLWIAIYRESLLRVSSQRKKKIIRGLCILNIFGFMLIRVFVVSRSLPYVLGWENEQQYLTRFRNGFLNEKIDTFYK